MNFKTNRHYPASVSLYFLLLFVVVDGFAEAFDSLLPVAGCPMAHCDPQMSDLVKLPAPTGNVVQVWHRNDLLGESAGSRLGIGCSGNGTVAACTYSGIWDNLVVYDYHGNRLWRSGGALNTTAYTSAPLLFNNGDIVACDNAKVLRFNAQGEVLWRSDLLQGGIPISPVVTESGVIILATLRGPIYAFDGNDGTLLGTLYIRINESDPGFFETVNTPAVRGNRIYVSTYHQINGITDSNNLAWLAAVDVDRDAVNESDRLRLAWHFEFGGGSGASPLLIDNVVYFDGDRPRPGAEKAPHVFAVRDDGAYPMELWRKRVLSQIVASFAQDPRPLGGFWVYTRFNPWLLRYEQLGGGIIQGINVDGLIGELGTHVPLSVMTVAGTETEPIMILSATAVYQGSTYIVAINLVNNGLLWKVSIPDIGWPSTAGQFPIVMQDGEPRIVFTTYDSGARALGLATPNLTGDH